MKISPFKSLNWTIYFMWIAMLFYTFVICYAIITSDKILSRDKKCAVIVANGVETHRIKLNENKDVIFDGVHIKIKSGRVSFCASDCEDQTCIKGGSIGKVGSTLACLPKNIVVQVVKAEE